MIYILHTINISNPHGYITNTQFLNNNIMKIVLHYFYQCNHFKVAMTFPHIFTSSSNAMVTVSMGQQHHQHHQQQQLWVQPDQSGFLPAAVTLSSQELALQGQLTLPTSSQDNSSLQELQQSHIDGNQYQDLGTQFPGWISIISHVLNSVPLLFVSFIIEIVQTCEALSSSSSILVAFI